ncbi:MAG: circularly permuted type 2 ATP-grasp protein [Cellulomonadaceae bacterium]|jgi:uncharacterized circularly permuted ATP-grasp superfamily protein|nr:circularly permuted type 2 ATP-grasp protein [Cellulomonadaceae bacterium]
MPSTPDMFDSYPLGSAYDEMLARSDGGIADGSNGSDGRNSDAGNDGGDSTTSDIARGQVRKSYAPVHKALTALTPAGLRARADALARSYVDQGVTFDFAGEERPFPLDVVPRVIEAKEWDHISRGVSQRVKAIEAFLADVYGPQNVVADGVVPRSLIYSSAEFKMAAAGITPPNGVRCHVSGIDIVRDDQGTYRVLEDNVRVPSGVSYVVSNRQAMVRAFPELFKSMRVRPVRDYPQHLLSALLAAAPDGVPDPTVVVLTPGVFNSAYYEHALLARLMGVELVEGRDLFCREGRVYMRTTQGARRVDVIYRRVDDDFLDPVQFRGDSVLGVPGLVGCARRGTVSLANGIGNGVADDKLVYTYMPDLIRYYLGEDPIVKNVDTWRLQEPQALEEVLDRLDELVVKPVDGSGGKGILIGPAATRDEINHMRGILRADPRGWIAQPVVQLSTSPTFIDGKLRPRHVDLRPFAVHDGDDVWVLPGGLTRVALPEGQLIVNSSQGGGSKDTWVLEGRKRKFGEGEDGPAIPAGTARDPLWASVAGVPLSIHPSDVGGGQQQQQQQQGATHHPMQQQQQQQQQASAWPRSVTAAAPKPIGTTPTTPAKEATTC